MPDAGHSGVPLELSYADITSQANFDQPVSMRPLLLLLEGTNDADFLLRISRLLYQAQASPIHLADLAIQGQIVIVPLGGWHLGRLLEPVRAAELS